nr:OpgC domain-containing protein [Octadecabacter dasysiphoniae]
MRISIFDGIRGFFLISMTMGHLSFVAPSMIGRNLHHTSGFIDAAQGFVAFSGLIIGLVYGKRLLSRGEAEMRRAMTGRVLMLLRWSIALCVAFVITIPLLPNLPAFLTSPLGEAPILAGVLAIAQLTPIWGIDILALYIVFMLLTPAVLIALHKGRWRAVALCSFGFWVLAQTGLSTVWMQMASTFIGLDEFSLQLGAYLNRLGWQVLYFGGLAVGFYMAQDRLDVSFMRTRAALHLLWPSLALIGVFYVSKIIISQGPSEWGDLFEIAALSFDRLDMSASRILVFMAYLYVGAWVLIAGPQSRFPAIAASARGLLQVLNSPALVFLGQHALQVFAWQAALVYLFAAFISPHLIGEYLLFSEGAVVLATLTIFIPAALNSRFQALRKRQKFVPQFQ